MTVAAKQGNELFVLSCLHTVMYPPPHPATGSQVYCAKCRHGVTVAKPPSRFHAKCNGGDCKRGTRDYGAAYVTAETKSIAHASRNPGHEVTVYDGETVIGCYKREPLRIDAPPF